MARSRLVPLLPALLVALLTLSLTPLTLIAAPPSPPPGLPQVLEFEMLALPWHPPSTKAAEVLAAQLSKVGIKIRLVFLESAIMYPRIMRTFDYDCYALAVSQSPNPIGMLNAFHSREARPGGANYWGYVNPEVDELVDKAMAARSREELKEYAWRVQEILATGPFIPLYLTFNTMVIRAEWKNYTIMPGGIIEAYNRWSFLYMYKSEKPEENVFRIAFPADIMSTNPFMATDLRSLWILNLLYDPLVALDPELNIVPWLAERWEVSPDGLRYTFYLRRGVRFHDGKELTADDVVFTFKAGIGNNTIRFSVFVPIVSDVKKVDDYTVVFELKVPSYAFLLNLATAYVYVAPKHIWVDKPIDWANPEPVGTGPFKWHSRVPGESLVLVRNPEYFIKGTPKISTIVMRVIPEADTRFLAIKKGEVDAERYAPPVTVVKEAEKDPNLKVVTAPDIWLVYLAFNFRRFNNTKLFEAINYAIDRDEIVMAVVEGYGVPVHTILNEMWHKELAYPKIRYEYNPEKAKRILEGLGYRYNPEKGVMEYVGPATPTPTPTPTPATPTTPRTPVESPTPTPATTETRPAPDLTALTAPAVAAVVLVVAVALVLLTRKRR